MCSNTNAFKPYLKHTDRVMLQQLRLRGRGIQRVSEKISCIQSLNQQDYTFIDMKKKNVWAVRLQDLHQQ
jgi:hypothetical protein